MDARLAYSMQNEPPERGNDSMKPSRILRFSRSLKPRSAIARHGTLLKMLGLVAAASLTCASMTGCATVAPYERGNLAHPTMSPEDMATSLDEHVRTVSEGATGGFGGGGGGCGCN